MITKEFVKSVWALKTAEEKREFILKNISEEYVQKISKKANRNDLYSNSALKLDTLVSNMLLKAEQLGSISSNYGIRIKGNM